MQPGTRHFVVTVEDCLAVGGHFYNADNYDRTAANIIYQHFLGRSISNTEHSDATFLLMKLVHYYYDLAQRVDKAAEITKNSESPTII
jgi:hypothetical protein